MRTADCSAQPAPIARRILSSVALPKNRTYVCVFNNTPHIDFWQVANLHMVKIYKISCVQIGHNKVGIEVKKIIFSLSFAFAIVLCACSSHAPSSQSLANTTAADVVEYINDMVTEADNIFIVGMDQPEDGDYSKIGVTAWMSMKFDENESGTLDEFQLYWFDGWPDEETSYSAGFYIGILTDAFVPEIQEDITSTIQNQTTMSKMSWNSNDTVVEYLCSGTGANYLTFISEETYLGEDSEASEDTEGGNSTESTESDNNSQTIEDSVVLDEDLSAAATKYMDEGFGHAYGNPTSWYDYIENIFIYSTPNDNYTATIFVSPDCQDADRIGNALMMNFDDVTIGYVMVVDDSGNILFERNNPLLE